MNEPTVCWKCGKPTTPDDRIHRRIAGTYLPIVLHAACVNRKVVPA